MRVPSGIGLRPLFIVNGASSDSVDGANDRLFGEVFRERCKADVDRDPWAACEIIPRLRSL